MFCTETPNQPHADAIVGECCVCDAPHLALGEEGMGGKVMSLLGAGVSKQPPDAVACRTLVACAVKRSDATLPPSSLLG